MKNKRVRFEQSPSEYIYIAIESIQQRQQRQHTEKKRRKKTHQLDYNNNIQTTCWRFSVPTVSTATQTYVRVSVWRLCIKIHILGASALTSFSGCTLLFLSRFGSLLCVLCFFISFCCCCLLPLLCTHFTFWFFVFLCLFIVSIQFCTVCATSLHYINIYSIARSFSMFILMLMVCMSLCVALCLCCDPCTRYRYIDLLSNACEFLVRAKTESGLRFFDISTSTFDWF